MLLRTALLTVMFQQPVWKSFSYLSLKITSEQVIKLTLSKIIRFHQGRTESSAQLQSFPLHGIITDFLQVSTFSRASILFQCERPSTNNVQYLYRSTLQGQYATMASPIFTVSRNM